MSPDALPLLSGRLISPPPPGGTILQLAVSAAGAPACWVASPAGLFHSTDGRLWRPAVRGLPLTQTGAVFSAGRALYVAGLNGDIARSLDGGSSWSRAWLEPGQGPVSCFTASPNFEQDGVLLAGVAGGGVLRSTDGGRIWGPANFGLRNFTLFDLIAAGEWRPVWEGGEEWVFAGTADGVYASPNGGRAWQYCGLPGMAVLSLAASPDFAHDRTVYAGSEADGLFVSTNGGTTWTAVDLGVEGVAVNAILMPSPPAPLPIPGEGRGSIRAIATSEYGVLFPAPLGNPAGAPWWTAEGLAAEAACLAEIDGTLLAGTYGDGLWRLTALNGEVPPHWEPVTLSARRFHYIGAATPGGGPTLLACQAGEGLWAISAGNRPWQPVELPEDVQPLRLARGGACNWLGASDGLYHLEWEGGGWQAVKHLEVPEGVTALTTDGRLVLAGSAGGRLWTAFETSQEFGYTPWASIVSPTEGLPVIALGLAESDGERLVLAAGLDARRRQIRVWIASLPAEPSLPERPTWEPWLTEYCDWQALSIAAGPAGPVLALGTAVLFQANGSWQRREVTAPEAPLTCLAWSPERGLWLAGTAGGLLVSTDLEGWETVMEEAVADVRVEEQRILALLVDGEVWEYPE